MSRIRIEIAERVVEIETIHPLINAMWQKFYTDKPVDFYACVSPDGLEQEQFDVLPGESETQHYNSKLESLAVHRIICEKLLDYNTFMIHGAAISVNGKGVLFCGKSGTGKTTHMYNWLDNCPDVSVINGDKPVLACRQDGSAVLEADADDL